MAVTFNTYAFEPPGPLFVDSDQTKFDWPVLSIDPVDLINYPDQHEVLGFECYIDTQLNEGHSVSVSASFYNDSTNELLWNGDFVIPQPSLAGGSYWIWYRVRFWIGRATWEIKGPMKVRMQATAIGNPIPHTSQTLYSNVVDTTTPPEEPLPGFWENLKTLWNNALAFAGWIISAPIIASLNAICQFITGGDITETTAMAWAAYVPGLNAFHKLATGKNLNGEDDTTVTDSEYVEMAVWLIPLPTSWVGGAFAKLSSKGGSVLTYSVLHKWASQEAALVAKGITKTKLTAAIERAVINQMARDIATRPTIWQQILNLKGPIFQITAVVVGVAGLNVWATWAATDNVATVVRMDANQLLWNVKQGTMTKEDALAQLDAIMQYFDYAENFMQTSYDINPMVRLLTPTFQTNMQLARTSLDGIRSQIEAYEPIPPAEDMGQLTVTSIPVGAKIYIDDEYKFEITNTMILVDPGMVKVTLKLDGYTDATQFISIGTGEAKTLHFDLVATGEPPVEPPPSEPTVPSEEVVIPLEPAVVTYNSWKVTIKAVDSKTGADLRAWILVNDEFMGKATPWYFYFLPEATYNIKCRLSGYYQGEVTFVTKPLPAL